MSDPGARQDDIGESATYDLSCGHHGRDWTGFPGHGPAVGVTVRCGYCRQIAQVVWVEGP